MTISHLYISDKIKGSETAPPKEPMIDNYQGEGSNEDWVRVSGKYKSALQTWKDSCIEFEDQERIRKMRVQFDDEIGTIGEVTFDILEIPPLECEVVTPNWIHPEEKFLRILETKER